MADVRLYLITPRLAAADLAEFAPRFAAALAGGDVASVLVRAAESDAKRIVQALLEIAAPLDVALLIEDDARLAARLGADGVHVNGAEDAVDAVSSLKGQRIVGVGRLALRDDAMAAGEAGADYVMFGEPDVRGETPSLAATRERVQWWAEIFLTPCVAYAARIEDAEALAADGADFIALGEAVWGAADPAAAVASAMECVGEANS